MSVRPRLPINRRCARETAGLDLSPCTQWHKFMEFWYRREGESQTSHTVVLLHDVWAHFKGDELRPTILRARRRGMSLKRSRRRPTAKEVPVHISSFFQLAISSSRSETMKEDKGSEQCTTTISGVSINCR